MGKVVSIPTAPHLKRIMLVLHDNKEPLKADLNNQLGLCIENAISKKTKSKFSPDIYSEILKVELSYDIGIKSMRISKLILINKFYSKLFKSLMIGWVHAQYAAGIPAYQAVKNFLEFYGIQEEEYSYETGYRAWLRYKNREYEQLKVKKLASVS